MMQTASVVNLAEDTLTVPNHLATVREALAVCLLYSAALLSARRNKYAKRLVLPLCMCTVYNTERSIHMARSTASRKYLITINNPKELGFTHDTIKNILNAHSGIEYWCLCDEIGAEGTPHIHVYAVFSNAVMFTTLQKRFYGAHLDTARGSNQECRDYIRKEGKWLDDKKHETNLSDTFEESGDLPLDREASKKEMDEILELVNCGASNFEILQKHPNAVRYIDKIERTRQIALQSLIKESLGT